MRSYRSGPHTCEQLFFFFLLHEKNKEKKKPHVLTLLKYKLTWLKIGKTWIMDHSKRSHVPISFHLSTHIVPHDNMITVNTSISRKIISDEF
jgi:hypothetical protein